MHGRRVAWPVVVVASALVGALLGGVAIEVWFAAPREATPAGQAGAPGLTVPRGSDLALTRARSLAAGGHLPDALRALDEVGVFDARRPDADRVRAEWQARLLELAGLPREGGR